MSGTSGKEIQSAIADLFVSVCVDFVRSPEALQRFNTRAQRAIEDHGNSPVAVELAQLKLRVNQGYDRRRN